MDIEEDHQELQLLPSPNYTTSSPLHAPGWPSELYSYTSYRSDNKFEAPSLDLQLSVPDGAERVKWQATEQARLAALEKLAYVERVRDLTRREMEMAQSEFSRARLLWERAREELEQAERLKRKAIRWINPTCMEITCQSCRQKFRS